MVLSIAESIDDPDKLGLLGQLAYEELLIFPPGDSQRIILYVEVQILSMGDIVLFLPLLVDKGTGTSCFLIEPMSDISSCRLDDGLYLCQMPMLLDERGEVVDVLKEGDPYIVGSIVSLQF